MTDDGLRVNKLYRAFLKRLIDIFISLIGLITLFIPMIIIAMTIKADSKGNVIFKQIRLGKNKEPFTIYKFRTMVPYAFEMGGTNTHTGDPRITKVGAFLRRTSLDELPQLINIIRGDMSIIGPRPILDFEFEPFANNNYFAKRFTVLPGLYCSVDVNLRSKASWEQQMQMDAEYSENISLSRDVKITLGVAKGLFDSTRIYRDTPKESLSRDNDYAKTNCK